MKTPDAFLRCFSFFRPRSRSLSRLGDVALVLRHKDLHRQYKQQRLPEIVREHRLLIAEIARRKGRKYDHPRRDALDDADPSLGRLMYKIEVN